MAFDLEPAKPGRARAVWAKVASESHSGWVWTVSAFVGLMFATAITGPIPAVADWQSAIVCASGTHLTHVEYVYQQGPEQSANGTVASGGTSHGFTYHCASSTSLSGSRTAQVIALQFLASMLVTVLLFLLFAVRSTLRATRPSATTELAT
jgi:hypothetical protein